MDRPLETDVTDGPFGESRIERFAVTASPETFGQSADIFQLWRERKTNGQLPPWTAFNFRDFCGFHAQVALSELTDPCVGPRFRIFGSVLTEAHGHDFTNQYFSELASAQALDVFLKHFQIICSKPMIGVSSGRMIVPGREHCWYRCLELPLAGKTPDQCFILHHFNWSFGQSNPTDAL